jgi:hypothetical protein
MNGLCRAWTPLAVDGGVAAGVVAADGLAFGDGVSSCVLVGVAPAGFAFTVNVNCPDTGCPSALTTR